MSTRSILTFGVFFFGLLAWSAALHQALVMVNEPNDAAMAVGITATVLLALIAVFAVIRGGMSVARRLGPLLLLIAAAVLNTGCGTTINPGYAGIVVDYYGKDRGVQGYTVTTGRVWYNPWTTTVLEWPTFVQTAKWTSSVHEGKPVNEEITFTNADGMQISADISVSYHLLADKLPSFYVKFRSADMDVFTHGFLRNLARDEFDTHAGKYKIEQIMGDNAEFMREVRSALERDLDPIGVKVDQFGLIGAPRPPRQVTDSINAKAQANQLALQKQNEIVQVQADAAKEVAKAEGHARAVLAAADAEASSNRKVADSLSGNLIEWRKLEKWNGALPTVTGGGVPLITLK